MEDVKVVIGFDLIPKYQVGTLRFLKCQKYVPKCQIGTLGLSKCKKKVPKCKNCTLEELSVLDKYSDENLWYNKKEKVT